MHSHKQAAVAAPSVSVPSASLLTPVEVCSFLKISAKTLQRLRMGRSLSYVRVQGQIRFRQSALERYLDKFTVRGAA
jgi:excisionase family DNA binding protein